jgi:hypothetical protein
LRRRPSSAAMRSMSRFATWTRSHRADNTAVVGWRETPTREAQ